MLKVKYTSLPDGCRRVYLNTKELGIIHQKLAVTVDDSSYWEFNSTASRTPIQLRGYNLRACKNIVEHWVTRLVDRGLSA